MEKEEKYLMNEKEWMEDKVWMIKYNDGKLIIKGNNFDISKNVPSMNTLCTAEGCDNVVL